MNSKHIIELQHSSDSANDNHIHDTKDNNFISESTVTDKKYICHVQIWERQKQGFEIQDIFYHRNASNYEHSVFVVPRRAYYDTRMESGKPQNRVLILTEIHDNALTSLIACVINGHLSQSISIIKQRAFWIRQRKPGHTHRALVVQCVGIPKHYIVNGSTVKLIYKKKGEWFYS